MKDNPYIPNKERDRKKAEKLKEQESRRKDMNLLSAGLNILVCFLFCAGIGYYIDHKLGTTKWTTYGVFFGLITGMYHFIRFIIKAMRDK